MRRAGKATADLNCKATKQRPIRIDYSRIDLIRMAGMFLSGIKMLRKRLDGEAG